MSLTIIAAVARNGVIGNSKLNRMPWFVKEEMDFFVVNTKDRVVVMGKETAEETGKLPGRDCLVLSRDNKYRLNGFVTVTVDQLLGMNRYGFQKEYMICGGASIYQELMPYASKALISYMDFDAEGDVMMPTLRPSIWKKEKSVEFKKFTAVTYANTDRVEYAR